MAEWSAGVRFPFDAEAEARLKVLATGSPRSLELLIELLRNFSSFESPELSTNSPAPFRVLAVSGSDHHNDDTGHSYHSWGLHHDVNNPAELQSSRLGTVSVIPFLGYFTHTLGTTCKHS